MEQYQRLEQIRKRTVLKALDDKVPTDQSTGHKATVLVYRVLYYILIVFVVILIALGIKYIMVTAGTHSVLDFLNKNVTG